MISQSARQSSRSRRAIREPDQRHYGRGSVRHRAVLAGGGALNGAGALRRATGPGAALATWRLARARRALDRLRRFAESLALPDRVSRAPCRATALKTGAPKADSRPILRAAAGHRLGMRSRRYRHRSKRWPLILGPDELGGIDGELAAVRHFR